MRSIAIPFLENLYEEIDENFSNTLTACSRVFNLVPSTLDKNLTPNTYETLVESVYLFKDDLWYTELFEQEYFIWKTYWKNKNEKILDTDARTLKVCDKAVLPNMYVLFKFLCVLSVTSTSV